MKTSIIQVHRISSLLVERLGWRVGGCRMKGGRRGLDLKWPVTLDPLVLCLLIQLGTKLEGCMQVAMEAWKCSTRPPWRLPAAGRITLQPLSPLHRIFREDLEEFYIIRVRMSLLKETLRPFSRRICEILNLQALDFFGINAGIQGPSVLSRLSMMMRLFRLKSDSTVLSPSPKCVTFPLCTRKLQNDTQSLHMGGGIKWHNYCCGMMAGGGGGRTFLSLTNYKFTLKVMVSESFFKPSIFKGDCFK